MPIRFGRRFAQSSGEAALFEIISTDSNAEIQYRFVVDGTVERAVGRNQDVTTLIDGQPEVNDAIIQNNDGTVTVTGETGLGAGDAWSVTGEILRFERTGGSSGVNLYLDGSQVSDPTGPVNPIEPPSIPTPSKDNCESHIMAAQEYAAAVKAFKGQTCSVGSQRMQCPMPGADGGTRVYLAKNGCEVDALRQYGWTRAPPDSGDGGSNGDGNGGNGGDGGTVPGGDATKAGLGLLGVAGLAYLFR